MIQPGMILLASASVTRRDMLTRAGVSFTAFAAGIDEDAVKTSARRAGRSTSEAAVTLAMAKASVLSAQHPDALVIGADQILECENDWFDKPVDLAGAAGHLARLRGRRHYLRTATVCMKAGMALWHHCESPCLTMRAISDRFITEYLHGEGNKVLDSVGAYRLEGPGIQLFERIEGDYFAILGLPLLPLLDFLRRNGSIYS